MLEAEKRWLKILSSALEGVTVEGESGDGGADFVIRTRGGKVAVIQAKWAGEGWPLDVRRVAAAMEEPWPHDVVLLAHRFSPGAIEWLRERGANWADEVGQARILGPGGLIVIREPAQLPQRENGPRAFSWSRSAISVAEAILTHEDRPLRVAELAKETDWSYAQVAKVLKAFDDRGWTAKRGAARGPSAFRELVDADGILSAWSAAAADRPRKARMAHRATEDVMALLHNRLAPTLSRQASWAVSGWAGLELAAPFATTTPSLHIYVADTDFASPLGDVIEEAGLREVEEGGRVNFWAADPRMFSFSRRVKGVPVASPPRLFADLSSFGGRGGDAAYHVKEQLIDPLHRRRLAEEDVDG